MSQGMAIFLHQPPWCRSISHHGLIGGRGSGLRVHGGDHRIFNNYIEGMNGYGIFLEGGTCTDTTHPLDPVDCTVAYNLVQGPGSAYSQTASSKNITYVGNIASMGSSNAGSGVMMVDAKLMKAGVVFTIGAGSPAVNAAMATFPYVMDDIQGKPRNDGKPDIGALELSPTRYGTRAPSPSPTSARWRGEAGLWLQHADAAGLRAPPSSGKTPRSLQLSRK
jgi:hypothetical protein